MRDIEVAVIKLKLPWHFWATVLLRAVTLTLTLLHIGFVWALKSKELPIELVTLHIELGPLQPSTVSNQLVVWRIVTQ